MRIVFFGTSKFSLPSLEAIVSAGSDVVAVFTQPDRRAGRGQKLTSPPAKVHTLDRGFQVFQPEHVRSADIIPFSPDAVVVVAYGQYLSEKLLNIPRFGGVNIHPSLLPRWRGAAPIQRALLAGDRETGVCAMRVAKEMDAGAILGRVALTIGSRDSFEDLHDKLADAGARLLIETLKLLERGEAVETEQEPEFITYAEKVTKEEAQLDWTMESDELDRRVRGLRPWPVAETAWPDINGGAVRVWRAFPLDSEPGHGAFPGQILDEAETPEGRGLRVRCGAGDLVLLEVQPPGKKRMVMMEFLRGRSFFPNSILGEPK